MDLTVDPPPDLIIEIEITSPAVPKLPLYAQLGIPEVWRYNGSTVTLLALGPGTYHEADQSTALPGLDRATHSAFMGESKSVKRTEWALRLRDWARQQGRPDSNAG